jgi:hypothetical protein
MRREELIPGFLCYGANLAVERARLRASAQL